jgi:hypothetical protein
MSWYAVRYGYHVVGQHEQKMMGSDISWLGAILVYSACQLFLQTKQHANQGTSAHDGMPGVIPIAHGMMVSMLIKISASPMMLSAKPDRIISFTLT